MLLYMIHSPTVKKAADQMRGQSKNILVMLYGSSYFFITQCNFPELCFAVMSLRHFSTRYYVSCGPIGNVAPKNRNHIHCYHTKSLIAG